MKLHLALLAMASSSGYLLFYLASDTRGVDISQNLAHWSRFVVEAPTRFFAPSAASGQESTLPTARISLGDKPAILLSGHKNTAHPVALSSMPGEQDPVQAPSVSPRADTLNPGIEDHMAQAETSLNLSTDSMAMETAPVPAAPSRPSAATLVSATRSFPQEPATFMDTSLLVTQAGGENATDRGRFSASGYPSPYAEEEDRLNNLLQSDTTAGRVLPGDSLGDEINLAARVYISNTADLQYPASLGFVVQNPDTELMIYALASRLNTRRLATPGLPPALQVYDANGELVASSDPLQQNQEGDPAVVHVFPPGAYRVVVSAARGSAGEVIIGVKDYYSVEVE
ncbi:hypothetical protein [Thiolapillus brandeum]|nr:hypothetical protein [Thiolapillus brandeum]